MTSPTAAPAAPALNGLERIFDLDPAAWSPRTAVFRAALDAMPPGTRPLTSRELFRILRARGFRESKRQGIYGFHGIRVPEALAELPALILEHSASSYRRGDRSPEARKARHLETVAGQLQHARRQDPSLPRTIRDRFSSPDDRAAELERESLAAVLAPLRREARELEQMIDRVYGPEIPEQHPDARKLRRLRDRISELYAEMRRA
ncbi:hypothetical protein SAMN02800687_2761 [Curtobacterium sp. UNCCL20]|uniref:hypothetical protein n=1 Tax=Curtobacterium sp. UNCCL20 TaxID=1502773 RepID=UPI00088031B4|nr:hypothetical protein [Curtobacterium sp. UNCCL20]SDQ83311.1 hypothetical protein SAMN02800687_2761 [Curtobacterium sp. UNCCL20]